MVFERVLVVAEEDAHKACPLGLTNVGERRYWKSNSKSRGRSSKVTEEVQYSVFIYF